MGTASLPAPHALRARVAVIGVIGAAAGAPPESARWAGGPPVGRGVEAWNQLTSISPVMLGWIEHSYL